MDLFPSQLQVVVPEFVTEEKKIHKFNKKFITHTLLLTHTQMDLNLAQNNSKLETLPQDNTAQHNIIYSHHLSLTMNCLIHASNTM